MATTNPLQTFFKLGDKVTKNDPVRKADWDYYMFWIIFLAFVGIFVGNIWDLFLYHKLQNLGWALFGAALMWFQYFGLKQMYEYRNLVRQSMKDKKEKESSGEKGDSINSVEDMLKEFGKK